MDGNLPHFPTAQYRACLSWAIFFVPSASAKVRDSDQAKFFFTPPISPRENLKKRDRKIKVASSIHCSSFLFFAAIIRQEKKVFPSSSFSTFHAGYLFLAHIFPKFCEGNSARLGRSKLGVGVGHLAPAAHRQPGRMLRLLLLLLLRVVAVVDDGERGRRSLQKMGNYFLKNRTVYVFGKKEFNVRSRYLRTDHKYEFV